MFFVPVCQNLVRRLCQLFVRRRKRRIDHWQFVRIRANGFKIAVFCDQTIGSADECIPQSLSHGLHAPVLPQEGMPPASPEIGESQTVDFSKAFDFFPGTGHGPGIEHLQFELSEILQDRSGSELHKYGEGRYFPKHHFRPSAFEFQMKLTIPLFEMIIRQAKVLEPLHEIVPEHLPLAVE